MIIFNEIWTIPISSYKIFIIFGIIAFCNRFSRFHEDLILQIILIRENKLWRKLILSKIYPLECVRDWFFDRKKRVRDVSTVFRSLLQRAWIHIGKWDNGVYEEIFGCLDKDVLQRFDRTSSRCWFDVSFEGKCRRLKGNIGASESPVCVMRTCLLRNVWSSDRCLLDEEFPLPICT